MGAVSSAVERFVYTEDVGSSILSPPTRHGSNLRGIANRLGVATFGVAVAISPAARRQRLMAQPLQGRLGEIPAPVGVEFDEPFPVRPLQQSMRAWTRKRHREWSLLSHGLAPLVPPIGILPASVANCRAGGGYGQVGSLPALPSCIMIGTPWCRGRATRGVGRHGRPLQTAAGVATQTGGRAGGALRGEVRRAVAS